MPSPTDTLSEQLKPYVPEGSSYRVAQMIVENKVHLTVTKPRSTKLGDYRPPVNGKGHRITLNKSLNKYAFLVTFVHEIAHLTCWNQYKNRVSPHGPEWKQHYRMHMENFLNTDVFPLNLKIVLINYMKNPAASSCSDIHLNKALQDFDPHDGLINLEDLEENRIFKLDGKKTFQKGPLERKRYRCLNLDNKRYYFVSALARIKPINSQ